MMFDKRNFNKKKQMQNRLMENFMPKFKYILFNPFFEDYKLYIRCEDYSSVF